MRIFDYHSGHVLIDIVGQNSLDYEEVVETVKSLHNPEIINETIPVEVQIGDDIRRIVQQVLELPDIGCLSESCGNSLKVKVHRNVITGGIYLGGCRDGIGPRDRNCRAVCFCGTGIRCHSNDSCGITACKKQYRN